MGIKCSKCHSDNPSDSQFCAKCGIQSKIAKISSYLSFIFLIIFLASCSSNPETPEDSGPTTYNINGFIQKGPFIRSSSITIQALNENLTPTGSTFNTETSNDSGAFVISLELESPYVEIIAFGYYFDEISGDLSSSQLTLRAISDVSSGDAIYVNILTHLEKNRIINLVNSGMLFAEAKAQAQGEILSIFNLDQVSVSSSDEMDITQSGDSNGVLLTVSSTLQQLAIDKASSEQSIVAELSLGLSMISSDLQSDGSLDNTEYINAIRSAGISLSSSEIEQNLQDYYSSLGQTIDVPSFEDFIDSDGDGIPNYLDDDTRTFTLVGDMSGTHRLHTATLLNNGLVLITGGDSDRSGAELFDPDTNTFTVTGSMTCDRFSHTATLLFNGKVLITGGSGQTRDTSRAELYDPNTETFSPTGNLIEGRSQHTATLLNDGKILICGSFTVASTELYDPTTEMFFPTGEMTEARLEHTATLLSDGRVLICGGYNYLDASDDSSLASAEIYDQATGCFTATGNMNYPRKVHTATLLSDGKVLVCGGYNGPWGAMYDNNYVTAAEIYDPDTGMFVNIGDMVTPRYDFAATLLTDGRVLIVGGCVRSADEGLEKSAEIFDHNSNSFRYAGKMNYQRVNHTATRLTNGYVLIAGGYGYIGGGPTYLSSAEIY